MYAELALSGSFGFFKRIFYYLYAVYSWLQVLTGTLFTGAILFFLRPSLADTQSESMPQFMETTKDMAVTAKVLL